MSETVSGVGCLESGSVPSAPPERSKPQSRFLAATSVDELPKVGATRLPERQCNTILLDPGLHRNHQYGLLRFSYLEWKPPGFKLWLSEEIDLKATYCKVFKIDRLSLSLTVKDLPKKNYFDSLFLCNFLVPPFLAFLSSHLFFIIGQTLIFLYNLINYDELQANYEFKTI